MRFTIILTAVAAFQVLSAYAQVCTVSPAGCTIGTTACPTGCIKSARCTSPCPTQKTVTATTTATTTATARMTVTPSASTVTRTVTLTQTRAASPLPQPSCAHEVPYINVFTFEGENCDVGGADLLGLTPATFEGPPNKLNTLQLVTTDGHTYPQTACKPLAVPNSNSAYFTIDGIAGTNVTTAQCAVVLFANADCTGPADVYGVAKNDMCLSESGAEWKSTHLECASSVGPA